MNGVTFADRGASKDLEDKKGKSPDRFNSVRGFFCPGLERKKIIMKGGEIQSKVFM